MRQALCLSTAKFAVRVVSCRSLRLMYYAATPGSRRGGEALRNRGGRGVQAAVAALAPRRASWLAVSDAGAETPDTTVGFGDRRRTAYEPAEVTVLTATRSRGTSPAARRAQRAQHQRGARRPGLDGRSTPAQEQRQASLHVHAARRVHVPLRRAPRDGGQSPSSTARCEPTPTPTRTPRPPITPTPTPSPSADAAGRRADAASRRRRRHPRQRRADKTAPAIRRSRLRRGRAAARACTFTLSEPASVTIRFKRSASSQGAAHRALRGRARPGSRTVTVRGSRLMRGRYPVEIEARDARGNRSPPCARDRAGRRADDAMDPFRPPADAWSRRDFMRNGFGSFALRVHVRRAEHR